MTPRWLPSLTSADRCDRCGAPGRTTGPSSPPGRAAVLRSPRPPAPARPAGALPADHRRDRPSRRGPPRHHGTSSPHHGGGDRRPHGGGDGGDHHPRPARPVAGLGLSSAWALVTERRPDGSSSASARLWYAVGLVTQYLVPGRRLRTAGVQTGPFLPSSWGSSASSSSRCSAVRSASLGIYLAEYARTREPAATWSATKEALARGRAEHGDRAWRGLRHRRDVDRGTLPHPLRRSQVSGPRRAGPSAARDAA